jgi:steroid delta-isomerase-like uncharacterized protein
MSETAIQLVTQLLEAWNAHDVERIADFYAPDYEGQDVAQARPEQGPEGIRHSLARYLHAFPDLHFTPEATLAQGNQVALFWTARGTHRGKIMNIPPTGRRVRVRGVWLFTLEAGKIRRAIIIWDVAGLLRAIGLLPEL